MSKSSKTNTGLISPETQKMFTLEQFNKTKCFSSYYVALETKRLNKVVNNERKTIWEKRWVLYFKKPEGVSQDGQRRYILCHAKSWPWHEGDQFIPQQFIAYILRNP